MTETPPRNPRYIATGYALDRLINAAWLNGNPDVTVSANAAQRSLDGARWACVLCWLLNYIVERNHCTKALGNAPTAKPAAIRGGIALLLFTVAVVWGAVALLRWVF